MICLNLDNLKTKENTAPIFCLVFQMLRERNSTDGSLNQMAYRCFKSIMLKINRAVILCTTCIMHIEARLFSKFILYPTFTFASIYTICAKNQGGRDTKKQKYTQTFANTISCICKS